MSINNKNDLKAEIEKDLKNIEDYLLSFKERSFGDRDALKETAKFGYFWYLSGLFITFESYNYKSVAKYLKEFEDAYPALEKYLKYKKSGDENAYEKEDPVDMETLRRRIQRATHEVLMQKSIGKKDGDIEDHAYDAVNNLLSYDSGSGKWRSAPMPRFFFYQIVTFALLQKRGTGIYHYLCDQHTSKKAIERYYDQMDFYFDNMVKMKYKEHFSDDERNRYISQAINILSFEETYPLSLLYYYACKRAEATNKYNGDELDAILKSLPPIFFKNTDMGLLDPDNPLSKSINPFLLQVYNSMVMKLNMMSKESVHQGPSPILYFDLIKNYLDPDCNIENDIRFYIIKMSVIILRETILKGQINIAYSEEKFAYFLNHYYNPYKYYEDLRKFRNDNPINDTILEQIKTVAANITGEMVHPSKEQDKK